MVSASSFLVISQSVTESWNAGPAEQEIPYKPPLPHLLPPFKSIN